MKILIDIHNKELKFALFFPSIIGELQVSLQQILQVLVDEALDIFYLISKKP